MQIGLIVPAVFVALGLFMVLTGLSTEGPIDAFGTPMNPKFAIALGGIGLFGGVMIAIEMITRKKRHAQHETADSPHA